MELTFSTIAEAAPGPAWQRFFASLWPAYERWYTRHGIEDRPTYLACRRALEKYMPELVPLHKELTDLVGGGDLEARFLSLYRPPAYLTGCSQAAWPGADPLLVRNYDYSHKAFDAAFLKTQWMGKTVMGMADCLIGLVDGVNEDGLAVSLTFGGSQQVASGFGVPIILRYVLQTCTNAAEAVAALQRVPSHMAYNVTVLDKAGQRATVMMAPGGRTKVTNVAVATNHQEKVEWISHANATATVERERFLLQRLSLHKTTQEEFIGAFLKPPLYSLAFHRGFGTLYTAAYWPKKRKVELRWPGVKWTMRAKDFKEENRTIIYPVPAERVTKAAG